MKDTYGKRKGMKFGSHKLPCSKVYETSIRHGRTNVQDAVNVM